VNGTRDKFLSGAGLSQQEDGRIPDCDCFNELQHLLKSCTLANDPFEFVFLEAVFQDFEVYRAWIKF
jgi:hypothetical protein